MIPTHLTGALALARHVRQLFVATADTNGIPHLAIAERITLERENTVGVFFARHLREKQIVHFRQCKLGTDHVLK